MSQIDKTSFISFYIWYSFHMKKPPYEYRIGIIMILLTAVPIGATQLGWYFYGKQVGFDFGMIAGTFSVILAGYLMYQKGWRDEDED